MRARALSLAFLATMTLGLPGCSDDPVSPTLPVTFSGTIQVMNGTTVPANARVLVFWGVSATSPDYTYVWGSGTVGTNGAFSITFDEEPPAAALNVNQLGVGLVVLTTDQELQEGQLPANYPTTNVIGISEDHSIIFTRNLDPELLQEIEWAGRFNGYGLGEVERNNAGFDSFRSVARDALRLIVDDIANLNPPNWT
jgi:hypothetical protein